MYSFNIRRMLHIPRFQIIILLFIAFWAFPDSAFSQRSNEINMPRYDEKKLRYGLYLGVNSHSYRVKQSQFFVDNLDSIKAVNPQRNIGLNFGFVVNYKLGEHLSLRALPGVSFYDRKIEFVNANSPPHTETNESVAFEMPILVKFKSNRRGNTGVYLVAGIKPGIEARSKKNEKTDAELRTKSFDLSAEIGIGLDKYFKIIKFSPEIRFSKGLLNLIIPDNNGFAQRIDHISSNSISLIIHFE